MLRSIRWMHAGACLALVGSAVTATRAAHAQAAPGSVRPPPPVVPGPTGFAVDRFDPSERGSEWFVMDSLDFRGNLRPALGVVAEWAHNPLVLRDANGNAVTGASGGALVSDQLMLHVGGSLVLAHSLRLAADLPFGVVDSGNGTVQSGQQFASPDRASLGDLRLSADLRLFGEYGKPFTATVGAEFWVPTGEQKEYTSDGLARAEPRLLVAGEIGSFAYAAKLGLLIRAQTIDYPLAPLGDELVYGASAGLRFAQRKLLVGPELYGSTGVSSSDAVFKAYTTPLELLVGGHYTVGNDWRVGAGFGPGLGQGYGTPDWRAVLSAEWTPGYAPPPAEIGDRDGDGITNDRDMCPDKPGPANRADPLANGCPPDRDHDTVADAEDACPDTPGVRTDDPKTNGCPPDRDHDSVADKDDACPDTPGVKTDDPKTNGCPPDRDHDSVADKDDACPDTPGVKTDDPKTNGCPPADPDRDKDGIVNEQDACPDTPGEKTDDPKTNGCPKAFVQNNEIKINEQVKFKFNSAVILKDSDDVLSAVAKILADHPELQRIRIEGHTDNVGTKAYNKSLSDRRAAAVVAWLVKHKIAKARLYSQGFGAERPIDTNATEEGRKNNRRVEFHIEKEGDSTSAATPAGAAAAPAGASKSAPAQPPAAGSPATPAGHAPAAAKDAKKK